MKKLRIYLDTSVIGGCFDPEFRVWSESLMEDFRQGRYVAVLSDVTAAEVAPAPDFVRSLHQELLGLQGYKPLTIYSPREVISYATEN